MTSTAEYLSLLLILLCLIISALAAVLVKGHIATVIILSVFSILSAVLFALLQAVDVAMAEAVIGAGFLTALFVTAVDKTNGQGT